MGSIFAKVLVWSLGTFVLSLVAYWGISLSLLRHGPGERDPMRRFSAMAEDDLIRAYEERGPAGPAEHLKTLDRYLEGEHFLTDANGRDLVTGADRSDLLRHEPHGFGPPRRPDGRFVLIPPKRKGQHRYRSIAVVEP